MTYYDYFLQGLRLLDVRPLCIDIFVAKALPRLDFYTQTRHDLRSRFSCADLERPRLTKPGFLWSRVRKKVSGSMPIPFLVALSAILVKVGP